jgi:hypothetical protein
MFVGILSNNAEIYHHKNQYPQRTQKEKLFRKPLSNLFKLSFENGKKNTRLLNEKLIKQEKSLLFLSNFDFY